MPSLRELQLRFAEAAFAQGASIEWALPQGGAATQRITIYRNNLFSNYRNALGASYPVVCRLVGEAFFNAAVDTFATEHPSTSGDLNDYGGEFGAFLARYPHAAELPYLADVAHLEWAIDEAERAADQARAPDDVLRALAAVAPERLPSLVLRLDPSCRLVASAFPVLRIWRVNQPAYAGEVRVDLGEGGDCLLIRRDDGAVSIERIDAATFAWLSALASGGTLGDALERATAVNDAFDLRAGFRAHIGSGTIAGIATS